MVESIISLKGICVHLGEKDVLHNVDLEVEEGSFVGLIGPNGGGKTTLLRVMLGLMKPTRGRVWVYGHPPSELSRAGHSVGYVPQRSMVDWDFPVSVWDVVLMSSYARVGLFRKPDKECREVASECLRMVGMEEYAKRPIGRLSGGQQKRVFIARALASRSKLLILDEPTAAVDIAAQQSFYHLLGHLRSRLSLTIIMSTHDIGAVQFHADRLACLNRVIYYYGEVPEVLSREFVERIYGYTGDFDVQGLRHHGGKDD
jgi:zinc transport system ATP-binding protein